MSRRDRVSTLRFECALRRRQRGYCRCVEGNLLAESTQHTSFLRACNALSLGEMNYCVVKKTFGRQSERSGACCSFLHGCWFFSNKNIRFQRFDLVFNKEAVWTKAIFCWVFKKNICYSRKLHCSSEEPLLCLFVACTELREYKRGFQYPKEMDVQLMHVGTLLMIFFAAVATDWPLGQPRTFNSTHSNDLRKAYNDAQATRVYAHWEINALLDQLIHGKEKLFQK